MAVSASLNGWGPLPIDSLTGVEVWKLAGSGGTPSASLTGDGIQGGESATVTVNKQRVALVRILSGTPNGATPGWTGAHADNMIYVWGNFLAAGLLNTQAAGGFGVILANSSTNYVLYYFYGSDNYSGGWKRMVVDRTKTPSEVAGSGIGGGDNIFYVGVFADVGGNTGRFDNLILDRIDIGTTLTITGTSSDLFAELLAWEEQTANRLGILTALNDSKTAFGLNGPLDISGTHQALDSKIFLAEPKYYQGGAEQLAVPVDFFKINHTGASTITYGLKVGSGDTARGRRGVTIVGNDSYDLGISFDDGSVTGMNVYGSSFEKCTGAITWGSNTSHELMGTTFNACAQFDPVGGVVIRNTTFSGYTLDTGAALLWNESINIKNSSFIANTDATNDPAAIEHTNNAGSPYTYDNLQFSGNDFDINNTSGGAIAIAPANGSNMSGDPDKNGVVTINAVGVVTTIEGIPDGAEWRLYVDSGVTGELGTVELDGVESKVGTADVLYNDSYVSDTNVVLQVFASGFKEYQNYFTLRANPQTISVNLEVEKNI